MYPGAADFLSHRFSTREHPERMRHPLWRESFVHGIVHADVEPLESVSFHKRSAVCARSCEC